MILIGPCIPVQMAVDLSQEQIEEFRQATTKLSIGWLVGWLFGWLVGWLVGWLMLVCPQGGLPALRQGRGWDHHHRGEQLTSLKNKHSKFSFWRAIILVNLSILVYIYNV